MTTTRPEVNFREPDGSAFRESLGPTDNDSYQYSSLVCNGCADYSSESYLALAFLVAGIVLVAIALLIAGRKYLHK